MSARQPQGHARRLRRGVSVWEMTFSLALAGLLIEGAARIAGGAAGDALDQAEARVVSAAADAVLALAAADAEGQIQRAAAAPGDARAIPRAELEAAGALDRFFPAVTPGARPVVWAAWAPDARTLITAAWASGDSRGGGAAEAGPGIDRVGRVGGAGQAACAAGRLCGAGVARDISGFLAALGARAPEPGDMLALRGVSLDARDPNLLRRTGGGAADLNRMETTLTVTGDVVNVPRLESPLAAAAVTGAVRAAGPAEMARAEFSGRLRIDGDFESLAGLSVSGGISGFGAVTAGGGGRFLSAEGREAELTVRGDADFGDLRVGARVDRAAGFDDLGLIDAQLISAPSLRATGIRAGAALISGAAAAQRAEISDLVVGGLMTLDTMEVDGRLTVRRCAGC